MESAFGVDHGEEIAKFNMPGAGLLKPLGAKIGSGIKGLSKPLGASAGRNMNAKPGMANAGRNMLGNAQKGLGMGASRAGKLAMAHPVGAGAGALGAGAAGVGGVSYGAGQRSQRRPNGQMR